MSVNQLQIVINKLQILRMSEFLIKGGIKNKLKKTINLFKNVPIFNVTQSLHNSILKRNLLGKYIYIFKSKMSWIA